MQKLVWIICSARIVTFSMLSVQFIASCNRSMLWIMIGDVARVNGQLAVSRAFGDKNLKNHLRSDPDIQNADIGPDTDLLILASDGLWKVISLSPPLKVDAPWATIFTISPHMLFTFLVS